MKLYCNQPKGTCMFEQDWYGFTGRLDVQQAPPPYPSPYPAAPDYAMLPSSDWRNTLEKRAARKRDGQRRRRELMDVRAERDRRARGIAP